jgi:hypothetical protein
MKSGRWLNVGLDRKISEIVRSFFFPIDSYFSYQVAIAGFGLSSNTITTLEGSLDELAE